MIEEVEQLYDKNIDCLVCNFSFISKKVRSKFVRAISTDTDFCSKYENEECSPLLYYVYVCPSCGYAFSTEADPYFKPGTKEKIYDNITKQWTGHKYYGDKRSNKDAIDSYKLAILSGMIKGERPIAMAGLHMRLAWMYRKAGNAAEEIRFLNNAVKAYEQSYFQNDYQTTDMSMARVLYLIGEIHRRLQNYKSSINYFSILIQNKDEVVEKKLVEMARDQWQLLREEQKNLNSN